MSSKVPYDLDPIEEERRDFSGAYYLQRDFNYIDQPSSSSAPDKIAETLDPDNHQKFAGIAFEITREYIQQLLLDYIKSGIVERSSHQDQEKCRNYPNPTIPISSLTSYIKNEKSKKKTPSKARGFFLIILGTVIGNLISHPCIVIRRQCQVNRKALRYHLSPFTLIPVIIRLQNRQGLKCLWKGAGGIFILRGCSVAIETLIAELTPFPREVSSTSSIKQLAQHIFLKFITYGILTPFYCASLVETVQSDIASEKPGVLDCLKEGVCRLFKWGTPHSTRLLPIWQLILPTALYGVSVYIISSLVQSVVRWFISMKQHRQLQMDNSLSESSGVSYLNNISTIHLGAFVANIVLFPAETILHRLYLQGTRTIIDNLDAGISVLPVISTYEGVVDCFHTIVSEEGASGLYKGFGALVLDYALQLLLLKIAKVTFQEVEKLFTSSANNKPVV